MDKPLRGKTGSIEVGKQANISGSSLIVGDVGGSVSSKVIFGASEQTEVQRLLDALGGELEGLLSQPISEVERIDLVDAKTQIEKRRREDLGSAEGRTRLATAVRALVRVAENVAGSLGAEGVVAAAAAVLSYLASQ